MRGADQGGGERADIGVGRDAAQVAFGGEVAGFWARPAVDAYRAGCARVADTIRQTGEFGEPEEWLSYWGRPYTRDEWLELVPTTGGFTRHPAAIQRDLLDGLGAAVDAVGGSFTMSYTTIAATAARLAD